MLNFQLKLISKIPSFHSKFFCDVIEPFSGWLWQDQYCFHWTYKQNLLNAFHCLWSNFDLHKITIVCFSSWMDDASDDSESAFMKFEQQFESLNISDLISSHTQIIMRHKSSRVTITEGQYSRKIQKHSRRRKFPRNSINWNIFLFKQNFWRVEMEIAVGELHAEKD